MASRRTFNIVVAVCHPDDEAIWAGGLLCEFARMPFFRTFVVCLSGNDPASPRVAEFEAARSVAGYTGGIILGTKLRPALEPLPSTDTLLVEGIAKLNLAPNDVDLLITHAPFGDEHHNPHHVQAYRELKTYCHSQRIGFGHFACIQLPNLRHKSMLTDLRRHGTLRLLQLSRCAQFYGAPGSPRYYAQFLTDTMAKLRMVECYHSIGLAEHELAYTMLSNPCEALYLMDDRALAPILALVEMMQAPGANPLIDNKSLLTRGFAKARHLLSGGGR